MKFVRKCAFPLFIVTVAAAVSWWSSSKEASIRNHVQTEITKLVPRFHTDPTLARKFAIDPILETSLASSLHDVYINSKESGIEFIVVVTNGDDKDYGDGLATHVATIQINNEPVAGYRVICHSDHSPLRIAGVIPGNIAQ